MAASLRHTPIHDSQLLPADLPQAMPAGQLPDNGKGPETERNASPIDPTTFVNSDLFCKYTY